IDLLYATLTQVNSAIYAPMKSASSVTILGNGMKYATLTATLQNDLGRSRQTEKTSKSTSQNFEHLQGAFRTFEPSNFLQTLNAYVLPHLEYAIHA
ncbi:unnamed protein product, partial [Dicrocoelium dendriticum]